MPDFVIVDGVIMPVEGLWEECSVAAMDWEELPLDVLLDGSLGIPQVVIVDGVVMPVASGPTPSWEPCLLTEMDWTEILLTAMDWTEVDVAPAI